MRREAIRAVEFKKCIMLAAKRCVGMLKWKMICKDGCGFQSLAQKADEEISLSYIDLEVVLSALTYGSLLPLSLLGLRLRSVYLEERRYMGAGP